MRYSRLVVSLLRFGGEMLGMKSLCAGVELIVAGFGDFRETGMVYARGRSESCGRRGFVGCGYSSNLYMKHSHQKTHITKGLYSI